MRRGIALVLIGLGVFAAALGPLLWLYVYDRLAVIPLPQASVVVSEARGALVFDRAALTRRNDVDLTATFQVQGDLTAPEAKVGGDVAVWQTSLLVTDADSRVVASTQQRVCVDRRTNNAVAACSRQYVSNDERVDDAVQHQGLIHRFPFDTQRRDYPFFDTNIHAPATMRYAAAEKLEELPVYRFVQTILPTRIENVQVPGDLVGADSDALVPAGRFYENTRSVWVEPRSGLIVKDEQIMRQTLRGSDGQEGIVVLAATFRSDDETVRRSAAVAAAARAQLRLLRGEPPILSTVAGLGLLATGIALARRRMPHPP